jgi:hypothetical protein
MRAFLAAIAALLVVAACVSSGTGAASSSPSASTSPQPSAAASGASPAAQPSVLPVVVSSEQVVGTNRFVFSFLDATTNAPAGSPDRTASVSAYPVAKGPSAAVTGDGEFIWSIPGSVGIYHTTLDFSEAGEWHLDFTTAAPGAAPETIPFTIDVQEHGSALRVGSPAPSVRTPVLADVGGDVRKISSDTNPDPAFYQTSLDQALAAHEPFVLVFATPAFCVSGACGPMLETIKTVAAAHPDLTFINVEPYKLAWTEGRLQPVLDAQGQLQAVPATDAFGIPSEPWTFVIDGSGIIVGSFEGPAGTDELDAAIAKATGA